MCWGGDRLPITLPGLGHEILSQNPRFTPRHSILLAAFISVALLGASARSCFWGLNTAVWGAGRVCRTAPSCLAFPVLPGGCGEGDPYLSFLSWPLNKAMASGCVLSPPATAPSPQLGHSKAGNVVAFSFILKLFSFLLHALPLWHSGQQGEGAFSQALHHMSLVFCVLFFPHCCPCQGKDIVEPLRLAGAVTLPANSLGV